MTKTSNPVETIILKTRSGKEGRDEVITSLYTDMGLRRKVEAVIVKYGGKCEDLHSVLTRCIMRFVKSVLKHKDLEINISIENYICGIAKHMCIDDFNEKIRNSNNPIEILDNHIDETLSQELLLLKEEKFELLRILLKNMGHNCQEVLIHWANGYTMTEISDILGYRSDKMAKKKKYECFKNLVKYIEKHPEIKSALR